MTSGLCVEVISWPYPLILPINLGASYSLLQLLEQFFLFIVLISLVEPLGGVLGESASIVCRLHMNGNPRDFVLRDAADKTIIPTGSGSRFSRGLSTDTHTEFILSEVQMSDAGRIFICSISEFNSLPVTFRVNCKRAN